MNNFLVGDIVWAWTTVLLHFVWQGLLVASLVGLSLLAFPKAESSKRYVLLVAGLLCMIALPIATWLCLPSPPEGPHANVGGLPTLSTSNELLSFPKVAPVEVIENEVVQTTPLSMNWLGDRLGTGAAAEANLRVAAFAIWIIMQMLLSGRLLFGALLMWRIRRAAKSAAADVQSVTKRLTASFGLRCVPTVVVSRRITDAASVGFFRATVILPAAWLTQLSPDMIESVLAHEFAHIRRRDQWVNLLQRVVETVFFYHPAVWWLSRQLRIEREHCCDADAVAATGDAQTFAKALELAARQRVGLEFGLATTLGGPRMCLLSRVQRVLGNTPSERTGTHWALCLVTLLMLVLWLVQARQAVTEAATPQELVVEQEPGQPPVLFSPAASTPPTPASDSTPFAFQVGQIATSKPDFPTELAKVSLPDYVIEPPDILLIEGIKLTPKAPLVIETQTVLQIAVVGTLPGRPIVGTFRVGPYGKVNLGPGYGSVAVAGLTTEEAAKAIKEHLLKDLNAVDVAVSIHERPGQQLVAGEHLVGPDGTVNLGVYGRVYVAGMTVPQARAAIEKHLANYFDKPRVSLDVFVYNSKFYYIIVEGVGIRGDQVTRAPVSGNETVLDAIALIGGLESASLRKIWVSRPIDGKDKILTVDFEAITRQGAADTNYQLLPGDRLFISDALPEDHTPETVEDVADRFNRLVSARKLEEAIKLARDASRKFAHNPVSQNMLLHAELLEENLAYRAQRDTESTANFIEELRTSRLKELAIQRALGTMVRVDFRDIPLESALESLAETAGIDILMDDKGLAAEGVTRDVPVTLQLKQKLSLRNALRLILDQHRLATGIRAGVLNVTSMSMADPVFVRTYAVRDLLGLPTRPPGHDALTELDYSSLVQLITSVIAPDSWSNVGGPGSIAPFPANHALVISASSDVHDQISKLLQQLRTKGKQ